MESFFRYIAYVDYYKDGEKVRNVGFLRWKLYKDTHTVEIQIKDVGNLKGIFQIQERNTQKVIGEITVDRGIGNFVKKYPSMSASGEKYIETQDDRLYLCDVEGCVIQLNRNEYLSVDVELEKKKAKQEEFKVDSGSKKLFEEDTKNDRVEVVQEDFSCVQEKNKKDIGAASENVLIEGIKEKYEEQRKVKIIEPLHEDKWQQLCREYPRVHPFSDKKTFLLVKPEDFIILQQEYQKLVHNSFLLHGFYNYGHMILGKLSEEEEASVYIGVPGVYYEREKQAARMFGFVGFESTEHPVQAGSYGYYMIEVEI